jgi:5'-phosphate synthase pdxT subunit
MRLIEYHRSNKTGKPCGNVFKKITARPTWGTFVGMILSAEGAGAPAVIENGQSLIGVIDITVCRDYFSSLISSFEMATPPPPDSASIESFPGVFVRAPAILL